LGQDIYKTQKQGEKNWKELYNMKQLCGGHFIGHITKQQYTMMVNLKDSLPSINGTPVSSDHLEMVINN
jgi:hypothetical protein